MADAPVAAPAGVAMSGQEVLASRVLAGAVSAPEIRARDAIGALITELTAHAA